MGSITHTKTNNIADWTQTDLDAEIALGNYPAGTVLNDIVLSSDWNHSHTFSLTTADVTASTNKNYVTDSQLTVIGNTSGTNTGDQTNITGNAGTVTVADAGGDTTTWVLLGTSQTGNLSPATDSALTFNATTNALSTTTFIGALTGNADTATTAAAWTNARNLAGNSVNGSANVPFANKFIVQGTADTGLSAAQFLGALATGLVKNTTTTGILSIAASGTDYADLAFKTISVSGQSDVVADTAADTLTFAAGANITITTNAGTDTITIAASSSASSGNDILGYTINGGL